MHHCAKFCQNRSFRCKDKLKPLYMFSVNDVCCVEQSLIGASRKPLQSPGSYTYGHHVPAYDSSRPQVLQLFAASLEVVWKRY